jgi:hypothetical protein
LKQQLMSLQEIEWMSWEKDGRNWPTRI